MTSGVGCDPKARRRDRGPRRTWALARAVLLAILVLGPPPLARAQGGDGARDIMRRVLRDSRADDEVVSVDMRLIDGTGRVRRRTATFYSKKRTEEDSVRLFRFYTPPEFSRSGILTIERSDRDTDQWIYLPAYHAPRRVSAANRGDTWMGTDFTYEDIIDAKIDQYEYRTLRHEQLRDVPCVVIEAIPKDKKLVDESAYSKTIFWVNADQSVALRVEYYNRAGRLFKILTNSDLRQFGKYRRWQRSEMHDVTWNHRTILEFADRKINRTLSDEYFEVSYLERGR